MRHHVVKGTESVKEINFSGSQPECFRAGEVSWDKDTLINF